MNRKIFFSALFLVLFVTLGFAVAHNIGPPTSNNIREDTYTIINITVNNSAEWVSITDVNITIPGSFTYLTSTNGSSAGAVNFTNTSTVLQWRNGTGLILNVTFTNYTFWFNASASTPGSYNITIDLTNTTQGTQSLLNFTVLVNDTTVPSAVSYGASATPEITNKSTSVIYYNISVTDNGSPQTIIVRLYNLTGSVVNSSTNFSSLLIVGNFSGHADGHYRINTSANDTYGNTNISVTRAVTIDTVNPLIIFGNASENVSANVSRTSITVNVSLTELNFGNVTFSLVNDTTIVNHTTFTVFTQLITWTGLSNANYTYNVSVKDMAGNVNVSGNRNILVDTTAPSISHSCTPTSVSSGATITCTCTATDRFDASPSISYTANPSTANTGGYTTTCTATDYTGNSESSSVSYTVNQAPGGSSSSSSSSGGSTATTWSVTHLVTPEQFSSGFTKAVAEKERFKVTVNNETHHVGVLKLTETTAVIEIASTPQTATLSVGQTKKFDSNTDGYYDISATLNSITNKKADITIMGVYEKMPSTASSSSSSSGGSNDSSQDSGDNSNSGTTGKTGSNTTTWIIVAVIVVIVIVAWILFAQRGKSKRTWGFAI